MTFIRKPFFPLFSIFSLVFGLLFSSCLPPTQGQLSGKLHSEYCPALMSEKSFQLEIHSVIMTFKDDIVEIRLQPYAGGPIDEVGITSDLLLLQIRNWKLIKKDTAIPLQPYEVPQSSQQTPDDWQKLTANAVLFLGKTCPEDTMPFRITGELKFTAFGDQKGDRIELSEIKLQLSDRRSKSHPKAQGQLAGQVSFQYHPPQDLDKDIHRTQ